MKDWTDESKLKSLKARGNLKSFYNQILSDRVKHLSLEMINGVFHNFTH